MKEYQRIVADIKKGRIAPVYLFSGEEPYLHRRLLEELEEAYLGSTDDYNYELFDGDTVELEPVIEAANVLPMFGTKRLVVVKNAPWFGSSSGGGDAPLLEYLKQPSPYSCLVFLVSGKSDKRKKVCKELVKVGVHWESQPLDGADLAAFVREWLGMRGKAIEHDALEPILAGHQGNLELLVRELEKLTLYLGDRGKVAVEDIEAVMVFPEQNNIFALTDAVGSKDASEAVWLLRKMLQGGEAPVYIISMLARQLRLVLNGGALAKQGYSPQQIAQRLQVHPYPVRKALAQGRNFKQTELIAAMAKILETDVAIKRGQGEPAALLEQAVIELCIKK
ncbi:MAG: DNA polymerase III subunit delta [Clostridia bacterium]|jgi:DNA polymerase-3 subunit delta|nr:DNA polymerase III subunit delta [Clostridia bacterium]